MLCSSRTAKKFVVDPNQDKTRGLPSATETSINGPEVPPARAVVGADTEVYTSALYISAQEDCCQAISENCLLCNHGMTDVEAAKKPLVMSPSQENLAELVTHAVQSIEVVSMQINRIQNELLAAGDSLSSEQDVRDLGAEMSRRCANVASTLINLTKSSFWGDKKKVPHQARVVCDIACRTADFQ